MIPLLAALCSFIVVGLVTREVRGATRLTVLLIAAAVPAAYLVAPWLR